MIDIKIVPIKEKLKTPANIVIAGIICLTILEIVALANGVNGTLSRIVVLIIAIAMGIVIPTPKVIR